MNQNPVSHLTEEEAKELNASRRRAIVHHNAVTQRVQQNLFRSGAAYKLDQQVRANMTNARHVNEWEIQREQAKAHAIIAAGGKALPPPNLFRRARNPYDNGRTSRYDR